MKTKNQIADHPPNSTITVKRGDNIRQGFLEEDIVVNDRLVDDRFCER